MKRILIALGLLGVVASAFGQASVTFSVSPYAVLTFDSGSITPAITDGGFGTPAGAFTVYASNSLPYTVNANTSTWLVSVFSFPPPTQILWTGAVGQWSWVAALSMTGGPAGPNYSGPGGASVTTTRAAGPGWFTSPGGGLSGLLTVSVVP